MRRLILVCLALFLLLPAALADTAPAAYREAPRQIVISFAGDSTLGCSPHQRDHEEWNFEACIQQNGMAYPFAMVKDIFDKDDLTVVNLESVFYEYEANKAEKTYNFRSPKSFAQILTLGGVDAVSFANNHMFDYGVQGYRSTLEALALAGIPWFGVSDSGAGTYIFEKDGIKIGFAAIYTSHWQNNVDRLRKCFEDLKNAGCNAIVGCMHGGVEYDVMHDLGQEKLANALIRYGADVVIGHHPHTLQGMRVENGRTTLWSLGNFVFGGNPKINKNKMNEPVISTMIAQVIFSFDEDGAYLGHQVNIIPCHMSGHSDYNDFQPCPVTGSDARAVIAALQRDVLPRGTKVRPYAEGVGALQPFVPAPEDRR